MHAYIAVVAIVAFLSSAVNASRDPPKDFERFFKAARDSICSLTVSNGLISRLEFCNKAESGFDYFKIKSTYCMGIIGGQYVGTISSIRNQVLRDIIDHYYPKWKEIFEDRHLPVPSEPSRSCDSDGYIIAVIVSTIIVCIIIGAVVFVIIRRKRAAVTNVTIVSHPPPHSPVHPGMYGTPSPLHQPPPPTYSASPVYAQPQPQPTTHPYYSA